MGLWLKHIHNFQLKAIQKKLTLQVNISFCSELPKRKALSYFLQRICKDELTIKAAGVIKAEKETALPKKDMPNPGKIICDYYYYYEHHNPAAMLMSACLELLFIFENFVCLI